jgi:alkanesulfonate monooxygenase SsuD/methylene tetrahydromethanopterin reductase-like flavin-dependent oxidoreductase (luciferase family)
MPTTLHRWLVFNFVGVLGFLVQLAALVLLMGRFRWGFGPATVLAVEAAVVHNFFWHERWTWADRASSFNGEFVNFTNALSYPKPANGRSVPVWFGGESAPALRRVAEYGDGWIGFNLSPDEAAAKIRRIEELLKAAGRKRSDVHLAVSPYTNPIKPDDLKRYRDAGAEEVALVVFDMPATEREMVARLEQMARDFVETAAKL